MTIHEALLLLILAASLPFATGLLVANHGGMRQLVQIYKLIWGDQ